MAEQRQAAGLRAAALRTAALRAAAGALIDKYLDPVAEPVRGQRCNPAMLALSKATQAKRQILTDASGVRRVRMPMAVIAASYFLRAGQLLPTDMLDIVDRAGPSTSRAGPPRQSGKE